MIVMRENRPPIPESSGPIRSPRSPTRWHLRHSDFSTSSKTFRPRSGSPGACQGHLDEALMLDGGTLATKSHCHSAGCGEEASSTKSRFKPRPRSISNRSESGWNGRTSDRWWMSLPFAQTRSLPLLEARNWTLAGSDRAKSVNASQPIPPSSSRRSRSAVAPRCPSRTGSATWPAPRPANRRIAGQSASRNERLGLLGWDRPGHLPAHQEPGGTLHVGHGPIQLQPLGRGEQMCLSAPVGQGAHRRAGGSPRWGSASPRSATASP